MSIADKIKSLPDQLGSVYAKPPVEKHEALIAALPKSKRAMEYLEKERGLTKSTIAHFKLGYDKARDAISIPVFKRGELINIRYRLLDPKGGSKYTQESGCEVWLYNEEGIEKGKAQSSILIVEGEFDLMSSWQAGFTAVISPASGKDSYGIWLELLDPMKKVYVAYDNDKPGKEAAEKMAGRIGFEKCREVIYPHALKDANDYFKANAGEEGKKAFLQLLKESKPFYTHKFKGVGDIINDLRFKKGDTVQLKHLPDVKVPEDYLMVISGKTNVGKTSYVMNLVDELLKKNYPVLVLPFERGPQVVGTRYLQVKYNYSEGDFESLEDAAWDQVTKECLDLPLYFAMPTKDETLDLIVKSKRIFNTKVVIIDHLDYMIRATNNKEAEIGNTLQSMKRVAEEHKIIMIVVTHIRKIESAGSNKKKKPNLDDLKGSSSLSQDPECVVMLSSPGEGLMEVDIVKNKGKMGNRIYKFNQETGQLGNAVDPNSLDPDEDDFKDFNFK